MFKSVLSTLQRNYGFSLSHEQVWEDAFTKKGSDAAEEKLTLSSQL